jgi:acetyl-CoA acetyltransferase
MAKDDQKACIVGVGSSEFTRWGGIKDRSQFQITAQAIAAAIYDAGLKSADIDGFASFADDANHSQLMQVALGVPVMRWSSMVWGGGGGGSIAALSQACAAVESGQASAVAVYRGLCQGQGRRYGRALTNRIHANFVYPFGLFAPSQFLALAMRRFMHLYPVGSEHMCEIALNARANANRNPKAVMHSRTLTRDDYFNSRYIAEPFRLFDCCLETDGACAVIVTTRERARDMPGPAVDILAATHGSGPGWGSGTLGSHNMPDEDYASSNSRTLAKELFGRAGVTPDDIDVAQIYDHFSGVVLMALEEYGFCGRGESGAFVASGAIRPDGKLPINTSGGQLSEAYVHGMNLLIEGVRQLRGTSTTQIEGAATCLVTGGLGVSPTSGTILRRQS